MEKKLTALELFAGAGGLSLGFSQAGFDVLAAIEIDRKIAKTFQTNKPSTNVLVGDIMQINPSQIKLSRPVDVIIGGPPCQGFSNRGKGLGLLDERNFLFKEFFKYTKYFNSKYFVIENVEQLISNSNGYFFKNILEEASKQQYKISYGVLNAKNFGVPQNRRRAIIIGSKEKLIKLPEPNTLKTITVWDAISDLAYLQSGEGMFESDYVLQATTEYQIEMRLNSLKLYNHIATNHSDLAITRLKMIPPEKGKEFLPKEHLTKSVFGDTWGRLEKNKPSPTILTRFDTPSNGKNNHPFLHRSITPREAARIQSFPDSYIFYGNKTSVIKQIGNAVPPKLAKAIAHQIICADHDS